MECYQKERQTKGRHPAIPAMYGPASFIVETLCFLKNVMMTHFLYLFLKCNKIPEERRYALPLKSIYMRQIDHMVGLY